MQGRRVQQAGTKLLILAAAVLFSSEELLASGNLGGRLIWTYQNNKIPTQTQDVFAQRYEVFLRDRLFERNDLKLAFYLDSVKNFTLDQTLLRYRGELGISHRHYSFDARYAPKQEITPLESPIDRELTEGQFTLDVHVPNTPRFRLFYAKRSRYLQGLFAGRISDLRGDLTYRWEVFEFGLNRWNTRSSNSVDLSTTVTGGRIRYLQSFGPMLNVQSRYEVQHTQRSRSLSIADDISTTHTFNALLSSIYQNILASSLSLMTRRLTSQQLTEVTNINDVVAFKTSFLPTSPLRIEFLWNYLLTKQNGFRNLSDYTTVQAILTGPRRGSWRGVAQMARRFVVDVEGNGIIPPHLYFLTLRGDVYRGIEARAELSVSEQDDASRAATRRFQSTSLLDLYLKPRPSWLITATIQSIKYSDNAVFLKNDRFNYGLTAHYFAREYFNVSADFRRLEVTTGSRQQNNSLVLNGNFRLRNRSTMSLSYGINTMEYLNDDSPGVQKPESRANTINLQVQVWVTQRGSFSLNYSNVDRDDLYNTSYLALNYRQDF